MTNDLIWRATEYTGPGADPDSLNTRMRQDRVRARSMHADDVERLRVDRDPCFKCGVRMDKHGERCR